MRLEKNSNQIRDEKILANLEIAKKDKKMAESDYEDLAGKYENMIRAFKSKESAVAEYFAESEKYRKEAKMLAETVETERVKNNELKHENSQLICDQKKTREITHQQSNLIEFLQRQNEELQPQKKKNKKSQKTLYAPPPLYKDLENQLDAARKEIAMLRAKLYGSNTQLDKIKDKNSDRR